MAKKKYLFYACYKNGHNGGLHYTGKKSIVEAVVDLYELLKMYLTNDIVFIGIVKCSDGKPLNHIQNLSEQK